MIKKRFYSREVALLAIAVLAVSACSASTQSPGSTTAVQPITPGAQSTPASQAGSKPRYTDADVKFMQGMIGHHAQALVMTAMVPTHGTRGDVRILAERIGVSQRDEIALMQRWLTDRKQPLPDTSAHHNHAGMSMPGMDMSQALMPGMLTPAQLAQLGRARGAEFDRLFLNFMIQHHEGAVAMVARLLATPGAVQSEDTYRFVADVNIDQTTEIDRMRTMLPASSDKRSP